ncbi:helix-turn-helix domain-containing protein [Priestia sp. SIMBA_032]|uniref:helix-turn-helix domain-containing protein n=1 Tax=Priestia sp. SIMBA_032 TaxID=3085775 RepID=UPI003979EFAC
MWHGLSRKQTAELLGVSYSAARAIWNGRHEVTAAQLWKASTAFNIPFARFYDEHDRASGWIYEMETDNG